MNSLRHARRGANAVEFALAVPALIAVLAAIIDLSAYMAQLHSVSRVTRDAARIASITLEPEPPTGAIIEAAGNTAGNQLLAVGGFDCSGGCGVATDWYQAADGYSYVKVTVHVPYSTVTGFFPMLDGQVNSTFTMFAHEQL